MSRFLEQKRLRSAPFTSLVVERAEHELELVEELIRAEATEILNS